MRIRHLLLFSILIILLSNITAFADSHNVTGCSEKPLIIKGLFIGVDVHEARKIVEQLLGKDWKISTIGETKKVLEDFQIGDKRIFGGSEVRGIAYEAERGFVIQGRRSDVYRGYVSTDMLSNKVTRITLDGELIDYIFSSSEIDIYGFVTQFRDHYNLPELSGFIGYWRYTSPKGYTITIGRDKFFDIKKEEYKTKIKFE